MEKLPIYRKTRLKYLFNLRRYDILLAEEIDFNNTKFTLEILQILYKQRLEKEEEKNLVIFWI